MTDRRTDTTESITFWQFHWRTVNLTYTKQQVMEVPCGIMGTWGHLTVGEQTASRNEYLKHYLHPDSTKESTTAMDARYHDMALCLLCGWTITWGETLQILRAQRKFERSSSYSERMLLKLTQ